MPRPTEKPYVPETVPPVNPANKRMADPWILFHNRLLAYVSTLTQRGLRADQPAATSVFPGTLYYVTDEMVTERSNGEIWESFSP